MLHDELRKINTVPFHMPGHKRNKDFGIDGSEIDITEIEGFDNLHNAGGIIKNTEDRLASLYGASRSFLLVNGTTVGIISAIFALTDRGDKIIISRNCHKSVYNACFLRELDVTYIEPEYSEVYGYYLNIKQNSIDKAISDNPDAKAVVITSPTYEGNVSNIHCRIPLIIDCAHGAHFGFGNFPDYPRADIVISSLHKTLPALTQTAVLNIYNDKFSEKVKMYLDIFETSSPSYVLMNSVSKCVEFLENSKQAFLAYEKRLSEFYKIHLNHLEIISSDDKGKIIISAAKTNIGGTELAEILRKQYRIECEMANVNYIILMTSVCDTDDSFNQLYYALKDIDLKLYINDTKVFPKPPVPTALFKSSDVKKTVPCPIENAAGKICGEYIFSYPPDIPIIAKGELLTAEIIQYILHIISSGVNVISDSNLLPKHILTKAD